MTRAAILLVVLFAMLWQSVALSRVGSTVNALADLEHATLHWQDQAHHHHDDGSYHLDDSPESAHHVITDHPSASLALAAPSQADFAPLVSAAPGSRHPSAAPNPTLDGLLRPPRSIA